MRSEERARVRRRSCRGRVGAGGGGGGEGCLFVSCGTFVEDVSVAGVFHVPRETDQSGLFYDIKGERLTRVLYE